MMKKLFLIAFISIGVFTITNAQTLPINQGTGKITFLEVVDANGVAPADLAKVVKTWATKQNFTITEDAADKLVYNAFSDLDYPGVSGSTIEKGKVKFSLSIFFKDGKYRYILTDFVHEGDVKTKANGGKLENVNPDCGVTKMSGKGWVTIKNKTASNMKTLTDDLKRVIKEYQNDPANKTDW